MCASIAKARARLRNGRAGVGALAALVSDAMVLSVGERFIENAAEVWFGGYQAKLSRPVDQILDRWHCALVEVVVRAPLEVPVRTGWVIEQIQPDEKQDETTAQAETEPQSSEDVSAQRGPVEQEAKDCEEDDHDRPPPVA